MKNKSLSLFILIILHLCGCEKAQNIDTSSLPDEVVLQVKNFTSAYASMDAIVATANSVASQVTQGEINMGELNSCAKITPDLQNKSLKVDFGAGCQSKTGPLLAGILFVSYTGKTGQSGSSVKASFSNFAVNENKIDGSVEINDFAYGANGNQVQYKAVFTSLKISQNGKTSIFNIDLSQSFKSGLTTAEATDNITASSITGNYTNEQSESFDIKTQKAIVTYGNCKITNYPLPLEGIVDLIPKSGNKINVDFGNGICDAIAKVTSGNISKEINLTEK